MNLPKNWYKRWDDHPGTLQWWTEYAIWKTLHKCRHGQKTWITATTDCDDAWQAEHEWVTSPPLESD